MRPAMAAIGIAFHLLLASAFFPGAASGMAAPDTAADRVVVTVRLPDSNVPMVSPSGRMSYLPMSPAERRRLVARQVSEIAGEFDLAVDEEWPIPSLGVNCIVFRLQHPERRDRVMQALAEHDDVDAVQALHFFTTAGRAADRSVDRSVESSAIPGDETDDDILQQLTHRASGRNVSIAVIDTGADLAHRNLQDARILARDMVDGTSEHDDLPAETHGTAILGLLLAGGDNVVGVRGYVPDADVRLLRACWEETGTGQPARCNTFTLARALSDVIESPVDIVNLSISGPRDPLLERLGRLLVDEQVVIVAGGESRNGFPGSVSSSLLAADLPARSGNTMTLLPGDRFGLRKGSSIDAARLTALVAMLKEMNPRTSAASVMTYLDTALPDRDATPANHGILLYR